MYVLLHALILYKVQCNAFPDQLGASAETVDLCQPQDQPMSSFAHILIISSKGGGSDQDPSRGLLPAERTHNHTVAMQVLGPVWAIRRSLFC
ncbi:hypothetical protein BD289DRAFT_60267 [Coniella lustricola]|uniref:Uncharacterized protein n=1 Tax=Coniella lustricola TaxID=2025994 RepID=A0A2T3A0R5_9PEZI|nr:hypothetical protein BD289DRAFT_60267 [Coniella lustricola]